MFEVQINSFVRGIRDCLGVVVCLHSADLARRPNFDYTVTANDKVQHHGLKASILQVLDSIEEFARPMDLIVCCGRIDSMRTSLDRGMTYAELNEHLQTLIFDLVLETSNKRFLYLEPSEARLFSSNTLAVFGQESCTAFPSLTGELAESAKCLALGRGTASVFHLMRSLESLTGSVWKSLDIPPPARIDGWGTYKKEIDDYLAGKKATSSPFPVDWNSKKPFYQEVHAQLSSVYVAWRNPTMHMERTYTVDHAKEIMEATKGLLRAVALHIDEQGTYTP
ncbi:MAG: hypothetical protein QOJ65_2368 [Fimbriimonadaceae bacterium]|nr:hypothetical protein [Fimbriimonadaceae bacterium]